MNGWSHLLRMRVCLYLKSVTLQWAEDVNFTERWNKTGKQLSVKLKVCLVLKGRKSVTGHGCSLILWLRTGSDNMPNSYKSGASRRNFIVNNYSKVQFLSPLYSNIVITGCWCNSDLDFNLWNDSWVSFSASSFFPDKSSFDNNWPVLINHTKDNQLWLSWFVPPNTQLPADNSQVNIFHLPTTTFYVRWAALIDITS